LLSVIETKNLGLKQDRIESDNKESDSVSMIHSKYSLYIVFSLKVQ